MNINHNILKTNMTYNVLSIIFEFLGIKLMALPKAFMIFFILPVILNQALDII